MMDKFQKLTVSLSTLKTEITVNEPMRIQIYLTVKSRKILFLFLKLGR